MCANLALACPAQRLTDPKATMQNEEQDKLQHDNEDEPAETAPASPARRQFLKGLTTGTVAIGSAQTQLHGRRSGGLVR
jgi:hypothetical protein